MVSPGVLFTCTHWALARLHKAQLALLPSPSREPEGPSVQSLTAATKVGASHPQWPPSSAPDLRSLWEGLQTLPARGAPPDPSNLHLTVPSTAGVTSIAGRDPSLAHCCPLKGLVGSIHTHQSPARHSLASCLLPTVHQIRVYPPMPSMPPPQRKVLRGLLVPS